ncbi:hypothetical protein BAUCODRAFT_118150 [Baudoinia panamericana UAMH 10762]|uniref:Uncharacterized protein n=1 Tax=Baudoinia panamericana (strain UAMH 10762) TaxID=717646 RepID=M2NLK1_BAUPA|nr:uncharacterized protein BAUCODRAFT_118150 [Baudoinia panamericana UAMH 10762]EMD00370.1 hypothetical protein BAUCODRAFT_118150 [Baudoinia panamericana UAMH 10762]
MSADAVSQTCMPPLNLRINHIHVTHGQALYPLVMKTIRYARKQTAYTQSVAVPG